MPNEPADTAATNSDRWDELRRLMPSAGKWAYFDHAAVAPLSLPARAALANWADDVAQNGVVDWPQWAAQLEHVRRRGAELLHADPSEIALIHSTTEGINLVAEGFPWQPGDNVVAPANEFPSNLYPWMNLENRGVEMRRVPIENGRVEIDDLARACDDRTRIITASWVGYASGWRLDVDALVDMAHRRGALVFLDAIQGLGVFPLDVQRTQVDFLSADGHKWLLGPEGAGLFYVRREHLDRLRALGVGWNSVVHSHDYSHVELNLKPAARRYEGGTYNMPGLLALGASLELLAEFPVREIGARVLSLTSAMCERLTAAGAVVASCRDDVHASGIISFELRDENAAEVRRRCRERQVVLSCREGRLRASPHAYNNDEDIDRLIDAIGAAK